jgi:hypothetical protein
MKYKIITFTKIEGSEGTNIIRIADNEIVTLGLGEQDPEYLAWVADGNTAEEWQPETTQPDMEEGN